jgi:hypothetical protein
MTNKESAPLACAKSVTARLKLAGNWMLNQENAKPRTMPQIMGFFSMPFRI